MTYNNQISFDFLEVVRHIPILEMLIVNELIKYGPHEYLEQCLANYIKVYWMLVIIIYNDQLIIILKMIIRWL